MDAAASALLGAAIGSIPSFLAMVIQTRMKDKRERSKQLTDLSIAQYKVHLEQMMAAKRGGAILPLSVYLVHNDLVLTAMERGALTAAKLQEIDAAMNAIEAVVQGSKASESKKAGET